MPSPQINILKFLNCFIPCMFGCYYSNPNRVGHIFITFKRNSDYISSVNSYLPPNQNCIAYIAQATIREWQLYNYTQRGRWNQITGTLNHTLELMRDLNNVESFTVPPDVWHRTQRWNENHPIEERLSEKLSHWFNEHYNSETQVQTLHHHPHTPSHGVTNLPAAYMKRFIILILLDWNLT